MAEAIIAPVQDQMAAELGPITADLGMIVGRAARRFGSKTALVTDGRTLTYQALDDLCDRVAGGLHDIGVRPGDRVSLYSPNRWEWVVSLPGDADVFRRLAGPGVRTAASANDFAGRLVLPESFLIYVSLRLGALDLAPLSL